MRSSLRTRSAFSPTRADRFRPSSFAGSPDSRHTVVPGQVLGLTSFLSEVPRTTAARTASDAVVFRLTRAAYEAVVGERSGSM